MGFLDKAKENLEKVAKQGQDKLDEVQSKKKADGLLRDLGAWTYAVSTGRDNGQGPAEVSRITAELQAHEAEHGPLGGEKPASADAAPSAPPASAPPPPPPSQAHAVPTAPPPAPAGVVPPPPPKSEHGTPAGGAPPPPTFAPIPPPSEPPTETGLSLDGF
jgi:hypothetical protein